MVLKDGRLVEENSTRKIMASPQQEYTRELLRVYSFTTGRNNPAPEREVILDISGITASYNAVLIPFWKISTCR